MGLLTPYFVSREGFLYTMIVPGGGFLLPSSRVPGFVPGGVVMNEIDTCIIHSDSQYLTAFIFSWGPYESVRILFGLINAPATIQMNRETCYMEFGMKFASLISKT